MCPSPSPDGITATIRRVELGEAASAPQSPTIVSHLNTVRCGAATTGVVIPGRSAPPPYTPEASRPSRHLRAPPTCQMGSRQALRGPARAFACHSAAWVGLGFVVASAISPFGSTPQAPYKWRPQVLIKRSLTVSSPALLRPRRRQGASDSPTISFGTVRALHRGRPPAHNLRARQIVPVRQYMYLSCALNEVSASPTYSSLLRCPPHQTSTCCPPRIYEQVNELCVAGAWQLDVTSCSGHQAMSGP